VTPTFSGVKRGPAVVDPSTPMDDNVDYRLLRYWRAKRWPALYAAAAEAEDVEVEDRLTDLVERLEARGVPVRSNVIGLLGPDDR
jgi:hypothetical protein